MTQESGSSDDAGDGILSLACGYAPDDFKRKLIVTFEAFIDDSRSDIEDRNIVLAGYVHTAPAWIKFSRDWKKTLNAPPAIEYFRMSEAENLSGQFRGWTEKMRETKVLSLGRLIRKYAPWSFECSVSQESFNRIVRPVAPYDLKNPYFMCFYGAIVTIARYQSSKGIDVPVDFVFDEQGGLGHFVALWYQYIKQLQSPAISRVLGAAPIFRDDKKVLPLQAADLLAWHLRRKKEKRNAYESREVMKHIFGNHVEARITDNILHAEAKKMSAVPGIEDVQVKRTSMKRLFKQKGSKQ